VEKIEKESAATLSSQTTPQRRHFPQTTYEYFIHHKPFFHNIITKEIGIKVPDNVATARTCQYRMMISMIIDLEVFILGFAVFLGNNTNAFTVSYRIVIYDS
jgi:hypothetical protein